VLEPEVLLTAYRHGIFPMAINRRGEIGWFSPDPRAVIPLDERFHVPHGLRRTWRRSVVAALDTRGSLSASSAPPRSPRAAAARFSITFDTDFESVIRACAKRREGTWISREIIESYCRLHRLGYAHSVEVWLAETAASTLQTPGPTRLAGGLYGVHIGGAFFGESMFHRVTDASKVALVALVERLRSCGFALLDTQWQTPHLKQFGTYEIPRREYLRRLERALKLDCQFQGR
jgi:leucyl/phenylalanyl-tRNA--protein transferase